MADKKYGFKFFIRAFKTYGDVEKFQSEVNEFCRVKPVIDVESKIVPGQKGTFSSMPPVMCITVKYWA